MVDTQESNLAHPDRRIDIPTVLAVTVIVYFLCVFLHEAVAHAGVSTILGVQVVEITNSYCRQRGASEMQARLIAGAGITLNTIAGFLLILLRRKVRNRIGDTTNYFLWFLAHMNLFSAGGYMAAFAFQPIGDVSATIHDLPNEQLIRIGILTVGIALIFWTFYHAARTLAEFSGFGPDKGRRARWLTMLPYLFGGIVNVGVSLIGKTDIAIILISAVGATFGGNFPLLWLPTAIPREPKEDSPLRTPTRSVPWIIAGIVFLGLFVVLGRGLKFVD